MPKQIAYLTAFGFILFACIANATALNQGPASESNTDRGRLAIIIDDIGYNLTLGRRTADLPGNFTLAVLPFTPHGAELAKRAHKRGKEIMLHAPMSNHHDYPLGRGGLTGTMKRAEFLAVLRQNLASVPYIRGVNNHMGSRLTEQAEPMRWLMDELQQRHLYFVDSRTSAKTQALAMAERIRLPSRKRDVFLDDERSSGAIRQQLINALQRARQQGSAIAIGHPYPETLALLEQISPLLEQYQVQLVAASQLMPAHQHPITKTFSCLAPPMSLWPQLHMPADPFAIDYPFNNDH
ncbi:divergent polysaccharide deacetylase family protein [Cellvibrio sp. pealriver]|uniref:divergent polysaccharide deacetylase family protein n=1 Tax=Cellvibrio sp. pealriver TaxID=1622269 RepID=UPI00069EC0E4|nr:divergent polysaccharide deacetylase family protein [Cellvibrio sp. pealriver]